MRHSASDAPGLGFGRTPWFVRPALPRSAPALRPARRPLILLEQVRAHVALGILECQPPLREFRRHLAALATQRQKVVRGAEALGFEQPERPLARALLEPRLQRPDLLHHPDKALGDGKLLGLAIEHLVHRGVQSGDRPLARLFPCFPCLVDIVPEQGGKQETRRHRLALAHPLVRVGKRQFDEFLSLRLLEDHVEQRQQTVMQAFPAQRGERRDRMTGEQQLQHFVEQARGRNVRQQRGQALDRGARSGGDRKPELRRQPHRAQHAHRVFAIAGFRIADQAQLPGLDVLQAAQIVPDLLGDRIVVQRIDGKVPARRIVGLAAEDVVGKNAPVLVGVRIVDILRRAEGRHLDGLRARQHVHQPESAADDKCAAKQRLDLLRRRVGGDVEVLGLEAEQQVAHGAADDKGVIALALQPLDHLHRAAAHALVAHAKACRGRDGGFGFSAQAKPGQQAHDHARDRPQASVRVVENAWKFIAKGDPVRVLVARVPEV